jgi:hypothetical protein
MRTHNGSASALKQDQDFGAGRATQRAVARSGHLAVTSPEVIKSKPVPRVGPKRVRNAEAVAQFAQVRLC